MSNLIAVRTKTGEKIHLAYEGSSRTLCGARVAARLSNLAGRTKGCGGCGLHSETTADQIAALLAAQVAS